MLQVQLLSGPPFTDLKTKKILNMKKEHNRHEKQERKQERKRAGQTVPYKKGAGKVMPCMYKEKGKRDAS